MSGLSAGLLDDYNGEQTSVFSYTHNSENYTYIKNWNQGGTPLSLTSGKVIPADNVTITDVKYYTEVRFSGGTAGNVKKYWLGYQEPTVETNIDSIQKIPTENNALTELKGHTLTSSSVKASWNWTSVDLASDSNAYARDFLKDKERFPLYFIREYTLKGSGTSAEIRPGYNWSCTVKWKKTQTDTPIPPSIITTNSSGIEDGNSKKFKGVGEITLYWSKYHGGIDGNGDPILPDGFKIYTCDNAQGENPRYIKTVTDSNSCSFSFPTTLDEITHYAISSYRGDYESDLSTFSLECYYTEPEWGENSQVLLNNKQNLFLGNFSLNNAESLPITLTWDEPNSWGTYNSFDSYIIKKSYIINNVTNTEILTTIKENTAIGRQHTFSISPTKVDNLTFWVEAKGNYGNPVKSEKVTISPIQVDQTVNNTSNDLILANNLLLSWENEVFNQKDVLKSYLGYGNIVYILTKKIKMSDSSDEIISAKIETSEPFYEVIFAEHEAGSKITYEVQAALKATDGFYASLGTIKTYNLQVPKSIEVLIDESGWTFPSAESAAYIHKKYNFTWNKITDSVIEERVFIYSIYSKLKKSNSWNKIATLTSTSNATEFSYNYTLPQSTGYEPGEQIDFYLEIKDNYNYSYSTTDEPFTITIIEPPLLQNFSIDEGAKNTYSIIGQITYQNYTGDEKDAKCKIILSYEDKEKVEEIVIGQIPSYQINYPVALESIPGIKEYLLENKIVQPEFTITIKAYDNNYSDCYSEISEKVKGEFSGNITDININMSAPRGEYVNYREEYSLTLKGTWENYFEESNITGADLFWKITNNFSSQSWQLSIEEITNGSFTKTQSFQGENVSSDQTITYSNSLIIKYSDKTEIITLDPININYPRWTSEPISLGNFSKENTTFKGKVNLPTSLCSSSTYRNLAQIEFILYIDGTSNENAIFYCGDQKFTNAAILENPWSSQNEEITFILEGFDSTEAKVQLKTIWQDTTQTTANTLTILSPNYHYSASEVDLAVRPGYIGINVAADFVQNNSEDKAATLLINQNPLAKANKDSILSLNMVQKDTTFIEMSTSENENTWWVKPILNEGKPITELSFKLFSELEETDTTERFVIVKNDGSLYYITELPIPDPFASLTSNGIIVKNDKGITTITGTSGFLKTSKDGFSFNPLSFNDLPIDTATTSGFLYRGEDSNVIQLVNPFASLSSGFLKVDNNGKLSSKGTIDLSELDTSNAQKGQIPIVNNNSLEFNTLFYYGEEEPTDDNILEGSVWLKPL